MTPHVATEPVIARVDPEGSRLRIMLNKPKANVIDLAMIGAIREAVSRHAAAPRLTTILFEAEGPNFSFGASVEEHRGRSIETMLPAFHGLFHDLIATGKVLLAAVRGKCLGGGLELAAFCHRVFAAPDSQLGCPEVKLGVFAPAASCILPARVGQPRADELLLTGRIVEAVEAHAIGLVDEISDDPEGAAVFWDASSLFSLSAMAVGHAARAARHRFHRQFEQDLGALERQYLDELRFTKDAMEGINSFLEKRAPAWTHC
jgi:cyclohexa-1,5-dienecarbonyl-CoA hydratase